MIRIFGASLADSPTTQQALSEALGEPAQRYTAPGKPLANWATKIPGAGTFAGDLVVVIEAGGNGIPTVEQIRAADQKLRATGARRVAWVTFADWPPSDVAENRRLTRDRIHVSAADVLTLPKPPVAKLTSDEVHFTTDGYRDLGTLIVQALRRAPASPVVVLLGGSALLAGLGYALYRLAR